ncbi:MAG: CYTH domain-containing protein [Sphaerochaetaceae bacterium]|nr:CYTH domain-containing protein [Sphaerochaetaceae bacterium]
MGCEVELKAHIDDYQELRSRIVSLRGMMEGVSEHKTDIYWSLPNERPLFRVREESTGPIDGKPNVGGLLFTRKDKQLQGAIEVNHEIEFSAPLTDAPKVYEFCESLGYVVYVRKEKTGWAWRCTPGGDAAPKVHIELVEVTSLGWFLEMECVLDDAATLEQIQTAQTTLLLLLDELNVPRTAIEDRYYMDMLLTR